MMDAPNSTFRRQLLLIEQKRLVADIKSASDHLTHMRQKKDALIARRDALIESGRSYSRATEWCLPSIAEARAWSIFKAEATKEGWQSICALTPSDRHRVLVVVSGGLGDALKASTLLGYISDRFDADIYVLSNSSHAKEIFSGVEDVVSVLITRNSPGQLSQIGLAKLPLFDLVVEFRYCLNFHRPSGSRLDEPEASSAKYEKYYKHIFPLYNNLLGRRIAQENISLLEAAKASLNSTSERKIHFTNGRDNRMSFGNAYVTIHNGFDSANMTRASVSTDYLGTKLLPLQTWREVVELLRARDIRVVQLGLLNEELVDGVDVDLRGLTTIEETAHVLQGAVCHVDTEGGLVHLAQAIGKRCVVAFGPTPIPLFGYKNNANLSPQGCKDCWWTTQDWMVLCPRKTTGPACMKEHSAQKIVSAVFNELPVSTVKSEIDLAAMPLCSETDADVDQLNSELAFDLHDNHCLLENENRQCEEILHSIERLNRSDSGWIGVGSDDGNYGFQFLQHATWHEQEFHHVWGRGRSHSLTLPLPDLIDRHTSVLLELEFSLLISQRVSILVDDTLVQDVIAKSDGNVISIVFPVLERAMRHVLVEFHLTRSTVPSARFGSPDDRDLGICLRRFRYKIIK